MGPVMNYVDEVPTDQIDLLVSPFEGEGRSAFRVPVNNELVDVKYVASGGRHTVNIGDTAVAFQVHSLGRQDISVVRGAGQSVDGEAGCLEALRGLRPALGARTGAPGRTRTRNHLVRSQVLYPLSYGGHHNRRRAKATPP